MGMEVAAAAVAAVAAAAALAVVAAVVGGQHGEYATEQQDSHQNEADICSRWVGSIPNGG